MPALFSPGGAESENKGSENIELSYISLDAGMVKFCSGEDFKCFFRSISTFGSDMQFPVHRGPVRSSRSVFLRI